MADDLLTLGTSLGEVLKRRRWQLTTAESCTGGWIAQAVTAVEGSSQWFGSGFVTYSNLSKQKLLSVPARYLEGADAPGAVSEETVVAMARGALKVAGADVSVATSGIAGPGGGTADKPVGTVWIGWAVRQRESPEISSQARCFQLPGDRETVRRESVVRALAGLLDIINNQ